MSSLRHAILGIDEFQPVHGYEIRRILQEGISSFWPVNLAGIYPSLRRLEEQGLVTHSYEPSADGRPDRKVFEITEAGRTEMARWRRLPPEGKPSGKVPLYLKLLFMREENLRDSLDWIDKAIEDARENADRIRQDMSDPNRLETIFTRHMRETGLAYAEISIEKLVELRERVVRHAERLEAEDSPDASP